MILEPHDISIDPVLYYLRALWMDTLPLFSHATQFSGPKSLPDVALLSLFSSLIKMLKKWLSVDPCILCLSVAVIWILHYCSYSSHTGNQQVFCMPKYTSIHSAIADVFSFCFIFCYFVYIGQIIVYKNQMPWPVSTAFLTQKRKETSENIITV